ncbi:helix-turn-helix transcriptional regulator [Streptomyces violaceorubidus]|uniref:helix-turn-helix transcriptional regulator n=1 Tax=Streptomyces violaceorubidus TaxID=284042 RepID=UPI0005640AE5|nr:LuxR family transcriptional regulator [Streptomyces violaceorubidus]
MSAHTTSDTTAPVGRASERRLVTDLLAALPGGEADDSADGTGSPRVLHISGGPGTGKTALLRFAARTAAGRGVPVLETAPAPGERALPYAALHSLLGCLLPRLDELPAAQRATLRAAFGVDGTGPAPGQLAAAALDLLTLAPGPVLLCADDVDLLDPASRDTVRTLARLCAGTGVGLVVTERAAPPPGEPAPDARTATLGPLPAPEARRLVALAGRVTTYAEEELVLQVARGNPLALTELSLGATLSPDTAGLGTLPATPRLAQAYSRDLEGLSPAAGDLLFVGALSTSPSARDVLTATARLTGDDAAARAGLEEALTRGLITRHEVVRDGGPGGGGGPGREGGAGGEGGPGRVGFPGREGGSGGEGVPGPVGVPGREDDPGRVGTPGGEGTPGRVGAPGGDGAPGQVAVPRREAGSEGGRDLDHHPDQPRPEQELRFPDPLLRIAVLARESGARRLAAHAALGGAVGDPDRAAWHSAQCMARADAELATRLEALAAGPRAGTDVLPALAALERAAHLSPDAETGASRLARAAELACHHGLERQARRYARGVEAAGPGAVGRAQSLWLHDLIPGEFAVGRERVADLCAAARAVAADHPVLAQKLLHAAAGRCWWQRAARHERDLVVHTFRDLRPHPWDARDLAVLALTDPSAASREAPAAAPRPSGTEELMLLGQVAHLTGDLQRAAPLLARAETTARAEGRHGRLPRLLVARALGEVWLGTRWATALALAEEGRFIAGRTGQADWSARAVGVQGILHALCDRPEDALRCATEAEEAALRLGQSRHLDLAAITRALAASGAGRYAEAYAQLRALLTERTAPYAFERVWALAFLAEAAWPAGERADAGAVVERIRARAPGGPAPLPERVLAYARAVLAEDGEAETRYAEALADGAEQWPLLYAMTRFAHGARLRRRRRLLESREPLAAAERVFRSLGAVSRADLAAAELRATGLAQTGPEQTAGVRDSAADLLTPQQLTIARLAARGLSNRAVAEQLRLSPRTVASHLYQIFPKLGITSRAQLAERVDPS